MSEFNRGLHTNGFIEKLQAEYNAGGWWRDIVDDEDLFIGIRDDKFNVYFNGCSLVRLEYDVAQKKLFGFTHHKYLTQISQKNPKHDYVRSEDGIIAATRFLSRFHGNLPQIKATATSFAQSEKIGVQEIIASKHNNVIDVELAYTFKKQDGIKTGKDIRADIVSLAQVGNEEFEIRIFEAKRFDNSEIKSKTKPKVTEQLAKYNQILKNDAFCAKVISSYRTVCSNLASIYKETGRYPHSDILTLDMFEKIGRSTQADALTLKKTVGLVIFGFGSDARTLSKKDEYEKKLRECMGETYDIIFSKEASEVRLV